MQMILQVVKYNTCMAARVLTLLSAFAFDQRLFLMASANPRAGFNSRCR